MKTLILFIWKHSLFFLFLILEGIATLLIVTNNNYQRSAFINASNGFTSSILSASNGLTHYIGLVEINEQLATENARLHSALPQSFLIQNDSIYIVKDSTRKQQYQYQHAEIINNSFQKRNNYLIINKGFREGVKPSMGVISSNGIVGIVKDVSENFSTVISVLHSKTALDVKIKSNGYTGTLVWSGKDYLIGNLNNIPSHVQLNIGDTIVSSGNSSIFPENIQVGIIREFNLVEGESFFNIEVDFAVNYNQVKHIYIVDNILKGELVELKSSFKDE